MSRARVDAARWISEARAGSNEALGKLFENSRAYLLRIASEELDAVLLAKGGASDIVQETFLEAQRDFRRFTGESERELLAWLRHRMRYRVSKFRRTFRETAKRTSRREVSLDDSSWAAVPALATPQPSPIEYLVARERDEHLHEALQKLPSEYRRVIDLRYSQSLSFGEIGVEMGRSENSARKLWRRAINRLGGDLGEAAAT